MAGYNEPTFQERTALAQRAREKALAKLAARKPMSEEEKARRKAVQDARDAAAAEKSAARKAAIAQAAEEKKAAAATPTPSEAELKAARDAKYAARKKRKK